VCAGVGGGRRRTVVVRSGSTAAARMTRATRVRFYSSQWLGAWESGAARAGARGGGPITENTSACSATVCASGNLTHVLLVR
jgi:hypothetical protein